MSVIKTTQYGGHVVMFLLNKIIKNKNIELSANKMLIVHMVLKPSPKQPMVLLYMVYEGLANGFKTMCKAS